MPRYSQIVHRSKWKNRYTYISNCDTGSKSMSRCLTTSDNNEKIQQAEAGFTQFDGDAGFNIVIVKVMLSSTI